MGEGDAVACGEPVPRGRDAVGVDSGVALRAGEALASVVALGGGVGVSARDAEMAPLLPLGETESEGEWVHAALGEVEAEGEKESC